MTDTDDKCQTCKATFDIADHQDSEGQSKQQAPKSAPVAKLNTALHAKLIAEGAFKLTSLESFRAKIRSQRVG